MMDRREFLRGTAWMGAAAFAAGCVADGGIFGGKATVGAPMQGFRVKQLKRIRLGIVGLGQRGDVAMPRLAVLPGVEIVALCDFHPERVAYEQKFLREHGYSEAKHTFTGREGYKALCQLDLDVVYNTTDWEHHAEVALEAMRNGKHVFTEVPAVTSVEQAWEMIETAEKAKLHCMMLENCCYGETELLFLNLCRMGKIGDLVHGEAAYIHDLREMCYTDPNIANPYWEGNGYENFWRLRRDSAHRGNQYPTHGLGPVCQYMNINRGDRMEYLVSLESRQANFEAYARANFPADSWKAKNRVVMGDMNTTLVRTALGRSIMIQHDVSSPRPYSRLNTITGTKGILADYPFRIGWEEKSGAGVHKFFPDEKAKEMREKFAHPYARTAMEIARKVGGHGGIDFMMDLRWAYCLQNGLPLDMDVYDLASWSTINELSERSVLNRSSSVDIPDFTRGGWKTAKPLGIVDVDLTKMDMEKAYRVNGGTGMRSI